MNEGHLLSVLSSWSAALTRIAALVKVAFPPTLSTA